MQQKIEKIFGYFGSIKNEPFYTSCIGQLVEIYQNNTQSLKFILYNLNHLIFSNCKEVRLRLKHRLIAASLVGKLSQIYNTNVELFMNDPLNFELQHFQLDQPMNRPEKVPVPHWEDLDIIRIAEEQRLLYSTNVDELGTLPSDPKEEEKVFDSFLNMSQATMLNIQNSFKDVSTQNEVADEAIKKEGMKYRNKVEKINRKSREQVDQVELAISNPFNLMYEICYSNLLNSEWELRHLAVLILKELVNSPFLGFSQNLVLSAKDSREGRFQRIAEITKDALKGHLENKEKRDELLNEIISRNIYLLALDRFADYQTEEMVILIRMVSAQILSDCLSPLDSKKHTTMIRMLRKVFERDTPMRPENKRVTWQLKHSFLYFLTVFLNDNPSLSKMVCQHCEECFIKMLANDQIDEVTLCICQIIEHFIGEPFFSSEKIDRMNRQIWAIVQNMDDLSVSAWSTLNLLVKLFPFFKLNQGNCIDRLKKFFISKIDQVRLQLYRLTTSLYSRKNKIDDHKVVQRNLVQILQAAIIEFNPINFEGVCEMMPHIMPYILRTKNTRKIVEFINTSVTPHEYTEEIINKKFVMGVEKDKSNYRCNEYLYIYEHQNYHAPICCYVDKRIWKTSILLKHCFWDCPDGLQQILKGFEKNNQRNHRAKALIFLLLHWLHPRHSNTHPKLFQEYKDQATELIKAALGDFTDNVIEKFYLPQLRKQLGKILQNKEYEKEDKNKEGLSYVRELSQAFKKNEAGTLKNSMEVARKLKILYEKNLNGFLLGQIELLLKILENIIKTQRELAKNIKILALRYLLAATQDQQVQNLNLVIRCIMESIVDDSYQYISDATAEAATILSRTLLATKKLIYTKFNLNLCTNVSSKYIPTEVTLKEKEGSVKLEGEYMGAMCRYIRLMGNDYLRDNWKLFIQEEANKQGSAHEYNRLMTLLSGTILPLLEIDTHPIQNQTFFVGKFADKIREVIDSTVSSSDDSNQNQGATLLNQSIRLKTKVILQKVFKYFSSLYDKNKDLKKGLEKDLEKDKIEDEEQRQKKCITANIFFEWFLLQIEEEDRIFFQVLDVVCTQAIVEISPVASLFILCIIKSITKVALHDVAMNCLSNLIVGVYTYNDKVKFSPKLRAISEEGIEFVKNFKDTSKFSYPLCINFKEGIELRQYQKEGITWLGFLTRYNLSGALCDDMGLGKTLQVLAVVENQYKKASQMAVEGEYHHSLIICPNTLMQHWAFQYSKYFNNSTCQIVVLNNKKSFLDVPQLSSSAKPIIFVTGYSLIQKNEQFFSKINLKFIILDEGHLIKNVKTLKFKAIKKLNGLHRFILTGTPIQNRLIQLWGLFDFLMPGYLYSEEQFKKHYQKLFEVNLTTFREDQLLFSDQQRRTLEKLHFKVMPFVMRRMKSEVLKEIPEKIINDHHCQLSGTQVDHYRNLEERIRIQHESKDIKKGNNALKNLHDMIHILNHPYLADLQSSVRWEDSGKFLALGEILDTFGIADQEHLGQNKAIIFAREKATIDLIERYLREVYPALSFSKLTADVKQSERFKVAQTFNGDSEIKVLIVTKAIGGVGLNLTAANIVVMFDSDYNPSIDIQAIDRAHRIGQKRVLNVYRLITSKTLEEKIMGIQKFKINLANSVVNMDNASIKNIKESHLPELLENSRDLPKEQKEAHSSRLQSIVAEMEKNAIETEEFLKRY